jgi:hypothetical protein
VVKRIDILPKKNNKCPGFVELIRSGTENLMECSGRLGRLSTSVEVLRNDGAEPGSEWRDQNVGYELGTCLCKRGFPLDRV